MNVNKTKYIIFGSKRVLDKTGNLKLKVNGLELERNICTTLTYLGVTRDQNLHFDKHVGKDVNLPTAKIN